MSLFKKKLSIQYDTDPALTSFNERIMTSTSALEIDEEVKELISVDNLKVIETENNTVDMNKN